MQHESSVKTQVDAQIMTKVMNLFKLLTNLLVGWKRWRRLLDTECFLPCGGALHCSVWTEDRGFS